MPRSRRRAIAALSALNLRIAVPSTCSDQPEHVHNVALPSIAGVTPYASSQRSSADGPQYAIDGSSRTGWISAEDVQEPYFAVDLGNSYILCAIVVIWGEESLPRHGYEVHGAASDAGPSLVPDDGWQPLSDMLFNDRPNSRVRTPVPDALAATPLRHVRVRCISESMCGMREVQVLAISATACPLNLALHSLGTRASSTRYLPGTSPPVPLSASLVVDGDLTTRWVC